MVASTLATATELEYFLEIYRVRHISRAAIRLGVSQPTLTQSLQKLEHKLHAKLFVRSKQGVVPTTQGHQLYKRAQMLLDQWKEVTADVQSSQHEIQGRFRLGCHPSVGSYTLPRLLENINASGAKIDLELTHDFSRKITEAVVSHTLDLGFVVNPVRHPDLVLKKLGDDRVLFWRHASSSKVPRRIFADTQMLQVQNILRKSQRQRFHDWTLVQVGNLELVRSLTLSGQGIGILPERVAKSEGAHLVPYDRQLPTFADEIYLVYRKETMASRAGKELVKLASFAL